jgi:hypothetical protein
MSMTSAQAKRAANKRWSKRPWVECPCCHRVHRCSELGLRVLPGIRSLVRQQLKRVRKK